MKLCKFSATSQRQDPPDLEDITAIIFGHRAPTEAELAWIQKHLPLAGGTLKAAPQSAQPEPISRGSRGSKQETEKRQSAAKAA